MRLDIKPLSVNEAWKGRRFRSDKYKSYQKHMALVLRPLDIPDGDIQLDVTFGFSNSASDIDNPLKPFIDCLQKKYGFNDKMIKRLNVVSEKVKKGDEFIDFNITAI